ncbi:MAG TPA: hypothetical protein VN689_09985, partial [Burkholderiales bacterium]|nr:hypothetical protein [Burkholderiales bacterium]
PAKPESRAPQQARSKLAKPSTQHLVVHEWGTFTAVAGRDGKPMEWRPLAGPSDLPSFVYDLGGAQEGKGLRHGRQCFKCEEATVRMETPVIYFYADREMTLSVQVVFTRGLISEWYPQARASFYGDPNGFIDWGRVTVLPGAAENLPVEPRPSHYYTARETDAALISVCGEQENQHEKFLFYRGIGNIDLPLTVKLEGDRLAINNTSGIPVGRFIVFENRNGQTGYRLCELRNGKLSIERPALNQSQPEVERELVSLLTKEGLYEKEARAMVATWRDSWFEDGLRVFYVVPRAMTDKTLPLAIDPPPAEMVRVLVGRTEIITPEMEQLIRKQLEPLNDASPDLPSITMQIIRAHGRFAEPILKEMIEKTGDERLRDQLRQIMQSARA